ncbi:hypothetical protein BKK49_12465 [Rodentibacter rarus]|uniref:Uncharacterized protein n=1 Tax=Rodentibacter rarus TaxID=1908260 RepID=A0A1V3IHA7_9PAST|nr:hypothetical protein [Rodentibacter rarus]OOF35556.1 hypothetical protein BKK49_12465 [Rodentibacter rarus]OOF40480.1 hypothetical protein BKK50_09535 [Rodentibacter rarus]
MIEIKNDCCLHHISGGNYSGGDPNCPGCRGDWDDKPDVNFNNWGGKYSGALSVAGSRFGYQGAIGGYLVGSALDIIDFQNLGENYKNYIMDGIKTGNMPND